jgi:hypothetical protein
MVLHQRQPLEVVVFCRHAIEKEVSLATEDTVHSSLLFDPHVAMDSEIPEDSTYRAFEKPRSIFLAAKRPALEVVASDESLEFGP